MKRKAIIPLVLGLGLGLLAVKLSVDAIRAAQAAQKKETFSVIRAKTDIPAFEAITREMVERIEVTDVSIAPGLERIASVDELRDEEGQGWRVAGKAIPEGTVILKSMLAPPGTQPGLTGRIPPAHRAFAVKIDEVTGVAYQLQPGDWVDVIVVMDVDSATGGRRETISEVILQHVQVAAIGYDTEGSSPGTSSAGRVRPARSATLFVPEEEIPKLHLAATRGRITLAMRGDDTRVADRGPSATMGDVLGKKTDPKTKTGDEMPEWVKLMMEDVKKTATQTEPEPVPHTVMVSRGTSGGKGKSQVEQITFESAGSTQIVGVQAGPPSAASAKLRPQASRTTARSGDLVKETAPDE